MNKIDEKLRFKSGIYYFINIVNGKRYVGSSIDIYNRLHEHCHNLKYGKAHNKHFQNAWKKYGEDSFMYGILEFCDPQIRFDREQYYIETLSPEYNLTHNVIANFGHTPSEECRQKISDTLKKKYTSGEIQTYRQNHAWKHTWVYNIYTYSLHGEYDCIADMLKDLNSKSHTAYHKTDGIISSKYGVLLQQPNSELEVINVINKDFKRYLGKPKYCIVMYQNFYLYFRTTTDLQRSFNLSKSMVYKHLDATLDDPYIPTKYPNIKLFFSEEFIPNTAVYTSEVYKLLSGNIGETPEMDNTEINSENKESESSYSVGNETFQWCKMHLLESGCYSCELPKDNNGNCLCPDTPCSNYSGYWKRI